MDGSIAGPGSVRRIQILTRRHADFFTQGSRTPESRVEGAWFVGSVAKFERAMVRERTSAGLAAARAPAGAERGHHRLSAA
jgi:DNA invertase Pin-like site-specific DNA recombinase